MRRDYVTVCIAALCRWNYALPGQPDDWATVAITASDRMITFGDVQYEPRQTKVGHFAENLILLIAGDYSLHSEAIKTTIAALKGRSRTAPRDAALIYGRTIQAIKRRTAEDIFLAPLGLNTDVLHAQQKEMSESLVSALVNQMQNYRGEEVEALIVGIEDGHATIYHIDTRGSVSSADDVGFAAIGSGAWHARSQLMQVGYTNGVPTYPALAAVFGAKKAADISPGVGTNTDIHIVFRNQTERLESGTYDKLHEIHDRYVADKTELGRKAVDSLIAYIVNRKTQDHEQGKEQPGGTAQIDGGIPLNAPEAARGNEVGKEEGDREAAE